MKIAVVQINTKSDARGNIRELGQLFSSCKSADVIITPECTNLMGFNPRSDQLKIEADDEIVQFATKWAKETKLNIILGSVLVFDERLNANVNRQLIINKEGQIIGRYDKMHMFDVELPNGETYRESDRFCAGNQLVTTQIGTTCFGSSICFDLRFPKLYRALAKAGAQVLVAPAAFTEFTGRAHWEVLLRARAIENGAYVIAPAQTGSYSHHDGSVRHCYGHSMVIDPWGEILADLGTNSATKVISLDLVRVSQVRSRIPTLKNEKVFSCEGILKNE